MSDVALQQYLKPLSPFLDNPNVSEILVNKPGEVWIESEGKMYCERVNDLTYQHLTQFARLVASWTNQQIDKKKPLLSGSLPGGQRIQIVLPPACAKETVVISIRQQVLMNRTLDDYEREGTYDQLTETAQTNDELTALFNNGEHAAFIKKAVEQRKNILISGGTSSGKSTYLRACVKHIPNNERLLTIEDAMEVAPDQPNSVSLFFSRNDQSISTVTPEQLLSASLRLRPDRVIYGELRGPETFDFLQAVNTGHDGSMTTVHANNIDLAF